MARNLVIVESPAKARTLSRFLGSRYTVKASLGHVRDLPKSRLGVDIEKDFTPDYHIPKEKKAVAAQLKEAAQKASTVYLATDPDREGEAISWHLVQVTGLEKTPVRRVVFHEITPEAVAEAFRHPRDIDLRLVQAQQARRILDRLVGYKLSPLLWQKVRRGLSAGRVQSVALRMIVDREREIENFVSVEYWTIEALLAKKPSGQRFWATLVGLLGKAKKLEIPNKAEADRLLAELKEASYAVHKRSTKEVNRQPAPPFTTSTLQQEASRKLHFSPGRTMILAQQLYEGLPIGDEGSVGLITYMRTDSTRVAPSARAEARDFIQEKFGEEFLSPKPRIYTSRAKGAQEAHEAIRPTSIRREPDRLRSYLNQAQWQLYELIWKRMVASQMAAASYDVTTLDIEAKNPSSNASYLFRATGSLLKFPGFLSLYSEGRDDNGEEEGKGQLPALKAGEPLDLRQLEGKQHFTQPPPRYTEATLIKALEENGIGRPSTYAPILSVIQERDYVTRVNGRLRPQELGFLVNDLLVANFPRIMDIGFTATMEESLDEIAQGKKEWVPLLRQFYGPFAKAVEKATQLPRVKMPEQPAGENCALCGRPMVIKQGRYGKFLGCSGYPECRQTKPYLEKTGASCPECGGALVQRKNAKKKRFFYGCANYPKCTFAVTQRPLPQPCPHCGSLLLQQGQERFRCAKCSHRGRVAELSPEAVAAPA